LRQRNTLSGPANDRPTHGIPAEEMYPLCLTIGTLLPHFLGCFYIPFPPLLQEWCYFDPIYLWLRSLNHVKTCRISCIDLNRVVPSVGSVSLSPFRLLMSVLFGIQRVCLPIRTMVIRLSTALGLGCNHAVLTFFYCPLYFY
jgi:hypothetical protein